jgi:hypothetical protein
LLRTVRVAVQETTNSFQLTSSFSLSETWTEREKCRQKRGALEQPRILKHHEDCEPLKAICEQESYSEPPARGEKRWEVGNNLRAKEKEHKAPESNLNEYKEQGSPESDSSVSPSSLQMLMFQTSVCCTPKDEGKHRWRD